MITDAMARALDTAGDGIGRVFAHFKVGSRLVAMSKRMETMEKKIKSLEKKLKVESAEADKGDSE